MIKTLLATLAAGTVLVGIPATAHAAAIPGPTAPPDSPPVVRQATPADTIPCGYRKGLFTWSYRNCDFSTVYVRYSKIVNNVPFETVCVSLGRDNLIRNMDSAYFRFSSATYTKC